MMIILNSFVGFLKIVGGTRENYVLNLKKKKIILKCLGTSPLEPYLRD